MDRYVYIDIYYLNFDVYHKWTNYKSIINDKTLH